MTDPLPDRSLSAERMFLGEKISVADLQVAGRPDGVFIGLQSEAGESWVFQLDPRFAGRLRDGLDAMLAHERTGWRSLEPDGDDDDGSEDGDDDGGLLRASS